MRSYIALCAALSLMGAGILGSPRGTHAAPPMNSPREYIVQPGDTLLGIALAFNVSVASIQALNNLDDPGLIRAGQRLKIPAAESQANEGAPWTLYTVQPGDTLSAIAARFRLRVGDLTRANGIAESAIIRVGQKLVIPVRGPAQPTAARVELIPLVPITATAPASEAPPTGPQPASPPANDAAAEVEAMRARLLELYNQARVANGVAPLAHSAVLQAAAQGHAEDCAARGWGSHIGSDGSRASQRIARAGYPGRITGENWALARSADQAFEMWYTREIPSRGPHLMNILSPRYKEVGFGIARASNGFYFLIANFGG
ncbi:MAG: LysM peptidoglycan-binding domain-containing protein [Thermoflexales bacterium]|nr:LysM peptidoglycan-binding domain-containing protein [Thermoflexales bacterium]MDW8352014.1 LysM peptidoglycan-binding domain-containing protein [Anaerolineae bacterium]